MPRRIDDPEVLALATISAILHTEYAVCLGISPFDAHCWVLPKAEIVDRWRRGATRCW